jgi:hypothetical protein
MKKIIEVLTLFLLTSVLGNARSGDYELNMKMVITSPDTQMIILNHSGKMDEAIEGYYFVPRYKTAFNEQIAGLQPGGFSFLDPNIFGGIVEQISAKWIKNKFPMQDIETMTNGMHIQKILSFQIKPVVIDVESDTLSLLIKYAVFDFVKQKDYALNYDYNVKLFYKMVHTPFDKELSFDFIDEVFENYEITFRFAKRKKGGEYLTIKNEASLFAEIKKSATESNLINSDYSFDIELIRYDEVAVNQFPHIAKYQEQNLPFVRIIEESKTHEKTKLPAKIYYGRLNFPFILYNTQKEELYKNYNTKGNIFQSTYDIIIVPIKLVNDSLTFDLFINYSKLNLDDDIKRWTPIKKRIQIPLVWGISSISLPKENWSAFFSRSGEEYAIYGYSDFERFLNEYIIIRTFKKEEVE